MFVAAIVVHLLRVFFTGAFRKPRELNWMRRRDDARRSGVLEGFPGYSLLDDLLSGMGLAIAYGVALSVPLLGGQLATLVWGGDSPASKLRPAPVHRSTSSSSPALLATLIAVHLAIIMRQKHTQFPGPGRREDNVVGTPMWPGYALRSLGLLAVPPSSSCSAASCRSTRSGTRARTS